MQIDFDSIETQSLPRFKNGEGMMMARMFFDGSVRVLSARLKPGSSIGSHTHTDGSEVMFFLSGEGKAVCDGVEEPLKAGSCHYCPKGSTHMVVNTGDEDLMMYCVVAMQ